MQVWTNIEVEEAKQGAEIGGARPGPSDYSLNGQQAYNKAPSGSTPSSPRMSHAKSYLHLTQPQRHFDVDPEKMTAARKLMEQVPPNSCLAPWVRRSRGLQILKFCMDLMYATSSVTQRIERLINSTPFKLKSRMYANGGVQPSFPVIISTIILAPILAFLPKFSGKVA